MLSSLFLTIFLCYSQVVSIQTSSPMSYQTIAQKGLRTSMVEPAAETILPSHDIATCLPDPIESSPATVKRRNCPKEVRTAQSR